MAAETTAPPEPARVYWQGTVHQLPPKVLLTGAVIIGFLLLVAVMSLQPSVAPAATGTAIPVIAGTDDAARRQAAHMQKELEAARARADQALTDVESATATMNPPPVTDAPTTGGIAAVSRTPTASASTGEERTVVPGRINHRAPAATPGTLSAASWLTNTLGATTAPARGTGPAPTAATRPASAADATPMTPAAMLTPTTIEEGRVIDTVLVNRLNGTAAGPVIVRVTNPMYGYDGSTLLIPQGATILGSTAPVGSVYDSRLAVSFHRLQMPPPDGRVYNLHQFNALSVTGEIGLRDKVNNHYLQIFGASAVVGLITGATQRASSGYGGGNNNVIIGGIGQEAQQAANLVLQRFINRPPELVQRPGDRVKVYVTSNLELPAWRFR